MYISCWLVAASVLSVQVRCHAEENTNNLLDPLLDHHLDPQKLVEDLFKVTEPEQQQRLSRRNSKFRSRSKAKTGLGFQNGGGASFINPKKLFVLISQLTKGIENNKNAISFLHNELNKQKNNGQKQDKCECVGEKGEPGNKGIPGPVGVPGARGMTVEHYHKSETKKVCYSTE